MKNPKSYFNIKSADIFLTFPAAGLAKRRGHLPCSKELLPVNLNLKSSGPGIRPEVIISKLLKVMIVSQIKKSYIVLRKGKWHIPNYLGNGSSHNTVSNLILI